MTDYVGLSPTAGTAHDRTHAAMLRRNVTALGPVTPALSTIEGAATVPSEMETTARTDGLTKRYDLVKAREALEFRLAIEDNKMHFDPSSEESWMQPGGARAGGTPAIEETDAVGPHREDGLQERFVMMSEFMKGLSQEDVEDHNGKFTGLVKSGGLAAGEAGGDDDHEMEEA